MKLTRDQFRQTIDSLKSAFSIDELKLLTREELKLDLEDVAAGKNKDILVFELVEWTERRELTLDLIHAAVKQRPRNISLQTLAKDMQSWHIEPPELGVPPYKGLPFYEEADSDIFYGRDQLVAQLVGHLRDHAILAIVGRSGCGKSSLLRAGLAPALTSNEPLENGEYPPKGFRSELVHIMTPGENPLINLAAEISGEEESAPSTEKLAHDMSKHPRCLAKQASRMLEKAQYGDRLLLMVDQFEEIFTLCVDEAKRKAFIDNLLNAASLRGRVAVVIALRLDFLNQCSKYDNLRQALAVNRKDVGDMTSDQLKQAIEAPAEKKGWVFEKGLVDLILQDVGNEQGALPLLSHALVETWSRRSGRTLTFTGYSEAGRVQGAISGTAEEVYRDTLRTPVQQLIMRNIMLRLTEVTEGSPDTRRRAQRDELIPNEMDQRVVDDVLMVLSEKRLVTISQNHVEIAHEALLREWPLFHKWLDESRAWLPHLRLLTLNARDWEQQERNPEYLLVRVQLEQVREVALSHREILTASELSFLDASEGAIKVESRNKIAAQRQRAILWVLSNALAWAVGFPTGLFIGVLIAQPFIVALSESFSESWATTLAVGFSMIMSGVVAGTAVSTTQWLFLRRSISNVTVWLATNASAWAIGIFSGVMIASTLDLPWSTGVAIIGNMALLGAITGSIVGGSQWYLLRHLISNTFGWLVTSAVSWAIGAALVGTALNAINGGSVEIAFTVGIGSAAAGAVVSAGQWYFLFRSTY